MTDDAIRIVRGVPTDEELAAIVGVLLTRRPAAPAQRTPPASRWMVSGRPGYALADGRPAQRGPQSWRASALPH
jgi:hypothetical protein